MNKMALQTAEELRIRNTSQEFLQEIIKTFPISPKHMEIIMLAGNILDPDLLQEDKQGEIERYFSQCEEGGVIPFSSSQVEYDGETGLFVPKSYIYDFSVQGFEPEVMQKAISHFIRGGKKHKLTFEVRPSRAYLTERGFDFFRRNLLDDLLSNDYAVALGDLWTTYNHLTGDVKTTGVDFGNGACHSRSGLILKLDHYSKCLKPKDREKMLTWFNDLKAKYE